MRWAYGSALVFVLIGLGMLVAGVDIGLVFVPLAFAVAIILLYGVIGGRVFRNYRGDPTNPVRWITSAWRNEGDEWETMRLRRAARRRERAEKRNDGNAD